MKRTQSVLCLALALAGTAPLRAQLPPLTGQYKDSTQKAAEAYARGLRARKKAQRQSQAGDAAAARKNYERAKAELSRAVGLQPAYHDALLALGEVYLALDERESALDACTRAVRLQPGDAAAASCIEAARAPAADGAP